MQTPKLPANRHARKALTGLRFVKSINGEQKLVCTDLTGVVDNFHQKYMNAIGGNGYTRAHPHMRKRV